MLIGDLSVGLMGVGELFGSILGLLMEGLRFGLLIFILDGCLEIELLGLLVVGIFCGGDEEFWLLLG